MQPASNNTERAIIIFMVVLLGSEQSEGRVFVCRGSASLCGYPVTIANAYKHIVHATICSSVEERQNLTRN
jgi:hypothetical protein